MKNALVLHTNHTTSVPYYENKYVQIISQVIGYVAEFSIVILNVPQIVLICRKQSAKNVSTTMIVFNIISGLLFLAYGILIFQWPMIIGNSLYLLISMLMMATKLMFQVPQTSVPYSPTKSHKDTV